MDIVSNAQQNLLELSIFGSGSLLQSLLLIIKSGLLSNELIGVLLGPLLQSNFLLDSIDFPSLHIHRVFRPSPVIVLFDNL